MKNDRIKSLYDIYYFTIRHNLKLFSITFILSFISLLFLIIQSQRKFSYEISHVYPRFTKEQLLIIPHDLIRDKIIEHYIKEETTLQIWDLSREEFIKANRGSAKYVEFKNYLFHEHHRLNIHIYNAKNMYNNELFKLATMNILDPIIKSFDHYFFLQEAIKKYPQEVSIQKHLGNGLITINSLQALKSSISSKLPELAASIDQLIERSSVPINSELFAYKQLNSHYSFSFKIASAIVISLLFSVFIVLFTRVAVYSETDTNTL